MCAERGIQALLSRRSVTHAKSSCLSMQPGQVPATITRRTVVQTFTPQFNEISYHTSTTLRSMRRMFAVSRNCHHGPGEAWKHLPILSITGTSGADSPSTAPLEFLSNALGYFRSEEHPSELQSLMRTSYA